MKRILVEVLALERAGQLMARYTDIYLLPINSECLAVKLKMIIHIL